MGLKIFLDGKFVNKEDAKVSVFDHGLLYGDGVFEGIRAYNGKIFKLNEHIIRLYESAKTIMLHIHMTKEEMIAKTIETVKINNIKDGYVRLVITRGYGDLGLDPKKCKQATIFIIADTIALYPQKFYEEGLAVITVPTRRNTPEALNPRIKSLNYLNNIMAKIEASNAGAFEAIMLNQEGFVAECTGDNIFIIKNGVIITPPTTAGGLEGVTRDTVMKLAESTGFTVKELLFTRHEIFNADECFLTGTAAEIIPVVKVDSRVIGEGVPGTITKKLMSGYKELVYQ